MPPQPKKSALAVLFAFVSPVASKRNVRKFEPGWNWPFSGRLNGVAPAAFAAALASNDCPLVSMWVSWIVTQAVSNWIPYELRSFWSSVKTPPVGWAASTAWNPIGEWVRADSTWRACILPPLVRSLRSYGRNRYRKLLGLRAEVGTVVPPTSSITHRAPVESFWIPSNPPRPKANE